VDSKQPLQAKLRSLIEGPEGAAFTVSNVEPVTPALVALMVETPPRAPVARPAAVIAAMPGTDEAQIALAVRFSKLPSL
jgi:hypothetical protein